jgi:hypothetical protein
MPRCLNQLQPPFLKYAVTDGHVKLSGERKTERIHYIAADHSVCWADPQKVRAEFWAEPIYKAPRHSKT